MKQVAGIGKGTWTFCKAYVHWANHVAEKHNLPDEKLQEMVCKGQFKTVEDARRFSKRLTQVFLIGGPIAVLTILILILLPKPAPAPIVVQAEEIPTPTNLKPVAESPPAVEATVQPTPEAISRTERFRLKFYEEVESLAGSYGTKQKYAVETMQAWESQPEGVEAGLNFTCDDIVQFSDDPSFAAQSAYNANEQTIPLEQLEVHYKAKFAAAKFVGCS